MDLLYLISFEGSISLASFSGAIFFFSCVCAALRGGCSSRARLHPATYYYTRTLLPVLWFDAKASSVFVFFTRWSQCYEVTSYHGKYYTLVLAAHAILVI